MCPMRLLRNQSQPNLPLEGEELCAPALISPAKAIPTSPLKREERCAAASKATHQQP